MQYRPKPPDKAPNWGRTWLIPLVALVLALFWLLSSIGPEPAGAVEEVPYSEIKSMIRLKDVSEAIIEQNSVSIYLTDASDPDRVRYHAVTPPQGDPELLSLLESRGVKVTAETAGDGIVFLWLLPWIVLFGAYYLLQRRMITNATRGGLPGGGLGGLFSGRFSTPATIREKVTFADVAGQDEAKREVSELVEFLRDPERFHRVGAEVPHGVLLVGPPGTGKTLIAKALAGEADVPFFSTSGSEFIEVFVGVGAGRVRRMFEAARKAAPSIIFIDELDSIGRTRGTGLGGGHDEREQTLNQVLAELDGFGSREAVVVLAATNRPDVLDPALLRPGRFDRHVTLTLPDVAARRAILDIHARNLPLENTADLDDIAAGTPGFSGADLKNLLNEAAIGAARRNASIISRGDLEEARDKVILGTVQTLAIQPEERHRLAVHEAGHTVAAHFTPGTDPLYKVTIIPRGRTLGGTHMLPEKERHTLPEEFLRSQLVVLLAGRAAEKLLIGTVSSGADDDINKATQIARSMVARWGMAEELGPVDLRAAEDHPFLGQSIAQPRSHADETAARVDREVIKVLKNAQEKALSTLKEHREGLERLTRELEAKETLSYTEIKGCLDPKGTSEPAVSKELTRVPDVRP
jgi:cell division protease FtsH